MDPEECARLLNESAITETRIRLKVIAVKQVINNGQPTCDMVWPDSFGQGASQLVDITGMYPPPHRHACILLLY